MTHDDDYMRLALSLAKRGLGNTAPNPSVGCVIVKDDVIFGRGWTGFGGRPHAETIALKHAGKNAKGATAYVTLEPCCHIGKTPPCAIALINNGIKRIVIAVADPYHEVAGGGIAALKEAGIEVEIGACEKEAIEINKGFFLTIREDRPLVMLKLATTLDGKIATSSGESKWITNPQSRRLAHLIRYRNDAIMVGVNTVIADNPKLTCRLSGLENYSPIRVIMDNKIRTPLESKIIQRNGVPPVIFTTKKDHSAHLGYANIISIKPDKNNRIDLKAALKELATRGVIRLLVEGGGKLAASFLKANLVDKLVWIQSPKIIGNDGIPAIAELGFDKLAENPTFSLESSLRFGNDSVKIYGKF